MEMCVPDCVGNGTVVVPANKVAGGEPTYPLDVGVTVMCVYRSCSCHDAWRTSELLAMEQTAYACWGERTQKGKGAMPCLG